MDEMISDIPLSNEWTTVRSINEGWSTDKKYYVKDNRGEQYLLRISSGTCYQEESHLYDSFKKLNKIDIPVSKLLKSGLCNNGKNTYRLFNWIEGIEIQKILGNLSEEEQYKNGFDAGNILRKIHEIGSPSDRLSWGEHYNQKIEKKIILYNNCGITFPNSERLMGFIQNKRSLIYGRPQSFHHGDFHIGNMLITPDEQLAIIDFNRLDYGDPWEEFNRIPWSASESSWFATGQINGYFGNKVPKGFFELMALYIAVNQLGAIPWAIPEGDKELKVVLNQTKEVLEWYENFEQIIPKWYQGVIN
jgi:aminoglycoside phosphotransferase (APT) family kinase protein